MLTRHGGKVKDIFTSSVPNKIMKNDVSTSILILSYPCLINNKLKYEESKSLSPFQNLQEKTPAYPLKLETLHTFQSGDQPSVCAIIF